MSEQDEAPAPAPIADPTALGLASFAIALFVLSTVNAGWQALTSGFTPTAILVGGVGLFLAGIWAFRAANAFVVTAFVGYGLFWLSVGTFFLIPPGVLGVTENLNTSLGFTLLAWTIFTLYMWVASFKTNVALIVLFTILLAVFVLLTLGFLLGVSGLITIGGYLGIIDALVGFYISAAGVIGTTFGRSLPM